MIDEVSLKNVLIGDRFLLALIMNGSRSQLGHGFISDLRETSLVSKLNYGLLHLSNLIHQSQNTVASLGFLPR